MYHLGEKTKIYFGSKAIYKTEIGGIFEGTIVKRVRVLRLFFIPISTEVKYTILNDYEREFHLKAPPDDIFEDTGARRDVTQYLGKELSPFFPKVIIVLGFLLLVVPIL